MDRFFTQETCDRCGGSLKEGRIMSMFSDECICMRCKEEERKREAYREACLDNIRDYYERTGACMHSL